MHMEHVHAQVLIPCSSVLFFPQTMARISTHRVAITNSERKVTGFISQSMIISLLDQHMDRLGSMASSHIVSEILPGLFDELKLVQTTDMALSAFKLMVRDHRKQTKSKRLTHACCLRHSTVLT